MKNIINKIVLGNQISDAGYKFVSENNETVTFGKGYHRILYTKLHGKTERYKYLRDFESKILYRK